MRAKQKAEDLFDKIYNISGLTKESKEIALIAVDELISVTWHSPFHRDYWKEVKQEIEKL